MIADKIAMLRCGLYEAKAIHQNATFLTAYVKNRKKPVPFRAIDRLAKAHCAGKTLVKQTTGGKMQAKDERAASLIRRLHQISVAAFAACVKSAGQDVTPVQFAALSTISANPDVDQATLAGVTGYDRVTMGGVIDRLEAKGLIRRSNSDKDRRSRVLSLTQTGKDSVAGLAPLIHALDDQILTALTPDERAQFIRLLQKTTAA